MKDNTRWLARLGVIVGGAAALALTGCTTYGEQPPEGARYAEVSVSGDASYVVIQTEADFYEPLSAYGRWEVVGSYGRCWIPTRVDAEWSPYADGYWRRTEDGWYWESEEPWGWATYHYGRWESDAQFGWYWVPQTRWAPAWVSWRHGDGYTGWAPMGPSGHAAGEHDRRRAASGGYVFVEDRQFLEPVRHQTVVVNATFINRTAVNESPSAAVIEKASGRKVQAMPVRELRRKEEAVAVTKHLTPPKADERNVQPPAHPQAHKPAPKVETRQIAREPAVKAPQLPAPKKVVPPGAPPVAPKKRVVSTEQPARIAKPVAEKPVRPDELRAPEQKKTQPAPAPLPTKAKDKRVPKPKTVPEVKAAPSHAIETPAPQAPPPERKRPDTEKERDADDAQSRGRSGP